MDTVFQMIYESKFGTVNFWDPYPRLNDFTKIGINLSGGVDSSLLLFFTCRKLKQLKSNAEIVLVTVVHNIWNAQEIVELFKEWFTEINWGGHRIDYYNKNYEKDKVNKHRNHENKLRAQGIIEVLFHGRTANPDKEEAKKHNLLYKREERRDKHGNQRQPYHEQHGKPFYCPFEYVDKRFIAEMYHKFNLMKDLFPITASCVEYAEKTDYFSKPCKECWWCREKKWAFGMYDGGMK